MQDCPLRTEILMCIKVRTNYKFLMSLFSNQLLTKRFGMTKFSVLFLLLQTCCVSIAAAQETVNSSQPATINSTSALSPSLQQCQAISCSCNSVPNIWFQSCVQKQKKLLQDCETNKGKILGYCEWQGMGANPSPLVSARSTIKSAGVSLAKAETTYNSKLWSMQQDFDSAVDFTQQSNYVNALATLKRVDNQGRKVVQSAKVYAAVLSRLDETDLAVEVLVKLADIFMAQGNQMSQWLEVGPNSVKFSSRQRRKALRYGGNQLEFLAAIRQSHGDFANASLAWASAAQVSEDLMKLRSELSVAYTAKAEKDEDTNNLAVHTKKIRSNQRIWRYYQAQAASRWAMSASARYRINSNPLASNSASQKAQSIWTLKPPGL